MCSKFLGARNGADFPKNYYESCKLDLGTWVEHEKAKGMQFLSLFIDYQEGKHRMVKMVPVLIRNAFGDVNRADNVEDWQLVKRFVLLDVLSGKNPAYRDDCDRAVEATLLDKYNYIRYVKSLELRFKVRGSEKWPNRIAVPLLILEYETFNSTHSNDRIPFEFKVSFQKQYSFDYLLEVSCAKLS